MARKYQWSAAKYRSILLGVPNAQLPGLRSLMYGFDAKDGFNVNQVSDWTAHQRRKVREAFHNIERLQGQPKRIIRARGANLKKLQDSFHGDIPSKNLKVAFIPDTEPMLTLPGAKKRAPKIRMLKEGISILRRNYERVFIPFDPIKLVKTKAKEVNRVGALVEKEGAHLFFVQVGEYQTIGGGQSLGLLKRKILMWMEQYDGVKPLPSGSGNIGDDPKHHHWNKWLTQPSSGIVGYRYRGKLSYAKLGQIIERGRDVNKDLKHERVLFMQRKGRKGRNK